MITGRSAARSSSPARSIASPAALLPAALEAPMSDRSDSGSAASMNT